MSKIDFFKRRDLWTNISKHRYVPVLGKTRMSRNLFDILWQWMVWSGQPEIRREHVKHSQFSWKLVDDLTCRFDDYRAHAFIPSEKNYIDESISRWYGQGGD